MFNKKERVNINNNLKLYRKQVGLSQSEVALLLAKALHTTVEKLFPLQASANAGEDKPNCNQANKK